VAVASVGPYASLGFYYLIFFLNFKAHTLGVYMCKALVNIVLL